MKNANITPEKVTASFKQAVQFFEEYFLEHDYDVFVCRTWLLYEPLQDLLSETSNITSFAKRFTIIAKNNNHKQAIERIYDTNKLEKNKQKEKSTNMQKKDNKN